MAVMRRRARVIPFPVRGDRAGGGERSAIVELCRCRDQSEALVVRALLDSEGITAALRSRLAQSVHPFSVGDQGEVTVLVADSDHLRAQAILARRRRPRGPR